VISGVHLDKTGIYQFATSNHAQAIDQTNLCCGHGIRPCGLTTNALAAAANRHYDLAPLFKAIFEKPASP
jgi:hypothetical protein